MSSTNSDRVDTFLAALRSDVVPMPEQARARLSERLTSLALISPVPQPSLPLHAEPARAWHQAPRALLAVPLALVVGAAGQAWLSGGQARTPAVVASAKPAPVVSAPIVVTAPSAALAAPSATQRTARPVAVASRPAPSVAIAPNDRFGSDDDLALLERARSAFAEGDTPGTLQLLRSHQQRFPSSMLQQEREALTIRALVAAGRGVEAKRRAEAFSKSYPRSALRGSVERAVGNFE
jgi:hypothetical protein